MDSPLLARRRAMMAAGALALGVAATLDVAQAQYVPAGLVPIGRGPRFSTYLSMPMQLGVTRAAIVTSTLLVNTFMVSGFSTAGDLGAGALYTSQGASSVSPMAVQDANGTWFGLVIHGETNAGHWGCKGDNSTNDSVAAQAAIDWLATNLKGGILRFPTGKYHLNVQLKAGVILLGVADTYIPGYLGDNVVSRTTLICQDTSKWVVDAASGVNEAGVMGIDIIGPGAGFTTGCVRFQSGANGCMVKAGNYINCGAVGLKMSAVSNTAWQIGLFNCNLDRAGFAAKTGAITCDGTDAYLFETSVEGGQVALASASLYACSYNIAAPNSWLDSCYGASSDIGFYLNNPTSTSMIGCRGDANWGPGFLGGGNTQFIGCRAVNNSRAGNGSYSGYDMNGTASNMLVGCKAYSAGSPAHKYGFDDVGGNFASLQQRTIYVGCRSVGDTDGEFNSATVQPQSFGMPSAPLQGTGATPDISRTTLYAPQDAAPITITDFVGGVSGQSLDVMGNSNVTIQNNLVIKTNTGADIVLGNGKSYRFVFYGAIWHQTSPGT